MGADVVGWRQQEVGTVSDLAEKVTLVPVDRFELVVPFDGLVLNADEQTIRGAPCFRESDWPGLAEPRWFPSR